jgi:hypothetical protein
MVTDAIFYISQLIINFGTQIGQFIFYKSHFFVLEIIQILIFFSFRIPLPFIYLHYFLHPQIHSFGTNFGPILYGSGIFTEGGIGQLIYEKMKLIFVFRFGELPKVFGHFSVDYGFGGPVDKEFGMK